MPTLKLHVAVLLLLAGAASGCRDSSGEAPTPAAESLQEALKAFDEATKEPSLPARRVRLLGARALLEPLAASDRQARALALKAAEMLGDLCEREGKLEEAATWRKRQRAEADAWLAADPADGALRGLRAYLHAFDGEEAQAWKLIEEGITATGSEALLEDGLLHYASALPARHEAEGRRAAARAAFERLLPVLEAWIQRARERNDPIPRRAGLLARYGTALVRLDRLEEASKVLDELRALDPAGIETFRLERLLEGVAHR